jgi:DNA polymerase III sliding clamp (beta) subunit (PCNA family)
MLSALKFVQGAVAKKDLLPAMTHFRIEKGEVRAYNGTLALSSPLPFDIDCIPKAEQLVKAISQCSDTITLSLTAGKKLRVSSGAFTGYVDTVEGETPHVTPAGQEVHFDGEALLTAFKRLYPFIGKDASRPWTNGILLRDVSAFATNNVTLAEYWLGTTVPFVVNIPRQAVKEILRIDEPPTHAQIEPSSVTFHYPDGRWIRTSLLDTGWPDIAKILDQPSNPKPIDMRLFEGMEVLKGLADGTGRLYILDGVLRTHLDDYTGGSYAIPGLDFEGCYQISMLGLLKDVVTHADFSRYPEPIMFFGDKFRGALIGMHMGDIKRTTACDAPA